jgi:hypothetical protein
LATPTASVDDKVATTAAAIATTTQRLDKIETLLSTLFGSIEGSTSGDLATPSAALSSLLNAFSFDPF